MGHTEFPAPRPPRTRGSGSNTSIEGCVAAGYCPANDRRPPQERPDAGSRDLLGTPGQSTGESRAMRSRTAARRGGCPRSHGRSPPRGAPPIARLQEPTGGPQRRTRNLRRRSAAGGALLAAGPVRRLEARGRTGASRPPDRRTRRRGTVPRSARRTAPHSRSDPIARSRLLKSMSNSWASGSSSAIGCPPRSVTRCGSPRGRSCDSRT